MKLRVEPATVGATPLHARPRHSDLEALLERPAWQRDALCREPHYRQLDWFPDRGEQTGPQIAVCERCLVRTECLSAALDGDDKGIWGGTTGRARKAMRRGLAAA